MTLAAVVAAAAQLSGRASRVTSELKRWRTRRELQLQGAARGRLYRRLGMRPSVDVDDNTLADRVKSMLGPIEKELDLPRIHITITGGVATLHGDVADSADARRLESAAAAAPGVRSVVSHLHQGLLASDTRPSQGRRAAARPSPARQRLLDAARQGGAGDDEAAERLAAAVLSCLAERLPAAERAHVLSHLPLDARRLAMSRPRWLADLRHVRDVHQFVLAVAAAAQTTDLALVERVIGEVLTVVRSLVPEEGADVAAVLPQRLRCLWSDPACVVGHGTGEVFLAR